MLSKIELRIVFIVTCLIPCTSSALPEAVMETCEESGRTSTPLNRFIIDANAGTAIDKKTGLMWERCFHGLTGVECNQYVESLTDEESASANPLFNALTDGSFITGLEKARIANENNYLGHNGWRVPSIKELMKIVDTQCYQKLFNDERKAENERNEVPFFNSDVFPISNGLIGSMRSIITTTPEAVKIHEWSYRIKGISLHNDVHNFGNSGGFVHSTGVNNATSGNKEIELRHYNHRGLFPESIDDYTQRHFYRGALKLVRTVAKDEFNASLTQNNSTE